MVVLYPFGLPIRFQVVQVKTPQSCGLSSIPMLINVTAIVMSGFLVRKFGYYILFSIMGGSIMLVAGSALIATWTVDISEGKWIGYQVRQPSCFLHFLPATTHPEMVEILAGAGLGLCLQQPNVAMQTILSDGDVSIGMSILHFFTFLGGDAIFVTVWQALLESQLIKRLTRIVPGVDPATLTSSGATGRGHLVPADRLDGALKAYNASMRSIWHLALGLACCTLIGAFGLEWKSVRVEKKMNEESSVGEGGNGSMVAA